jgi:hypothetical protein
VAVPVYHLDQPNAGWDIRLSGFDEAAGAVDNERETGSGVDEGAERVEAVAPREAKAHELPKHHADRAHDVDEGRLTSLGPVLLG